MTFPRRLSRFLCAVAVLGTTAGPAVAATTEIGAVAEIRAGERPDPMTAAAGAGTYVAQVAGGSGSYAVPAGFRVITAWSHLTGSTAGELTFKVYRPIAPGRFLVVAADTRSVTPGTVHRFAVRIPVEPGDRIGISTSQVEVAYSSNDPADQLAFFNFEEPDPPVGTEVDQDGNPGPGLRAAVAAAAETDADRDGFGDQTQDRCPTSASTQGACPAARADPLPPASPLTPFAGCLASTANIVRGTLASESIVGTARADRIFAGTGNDVVDGLAAADCIDLGPGTDRGQGGSGSDLILGGPGRDRIAGSSGNDRLTAGSSGDRLIGGFGDDRLLGGSGADRVNGERGRDRVSGGSSGDVISAGSSNDRVAGDQGNDRINGNSGNDSLSGSSGNDRITGSTGADRISGGSGNDRIAAHDGRRDRINCGTGRDSVLADRVDRVARNCERVR